jgi:hypothetical protein
MGDRDPQGDGIYPEIQVFIPQSSRFFAVFRVIIPQRTGKEVNAVALGPLSSGVSYPAELG